MSLTPEPELDCCCKFCRFVLSLLRKLSKRFETVPKLKKKDNNEIKNEKNISKKLWKIIFRGFQNETLKRYTERRPTFFKKYHLPYISAWNYNTNRNNM